MTSSVNGVLMLVDEFLPLAIDGAERQAAHLAKYMVDRHSLWVGVLTRRFGNLSRFEKRDSYNVFRVGRYEHTKILRSLTFTLSAIVKILALNGKFDILHAHLAFSPAVAATIAGKLLRKKIIVKFGNSGEYGDVETSKRNWRGRLAMNLFRKWADVCIALSSDMEREMLDAGFSRTQVVRMVNGVDTSKFFPSTNKEIDSRCFQLDGMPKILLYTGRLTNQKSLDTLLVAFSKAITKVQGLHLVIVGDGENRDMLEDLSADLGINRNVTFLRWVEDITPYLRGANIFVLPSLSEGISNSLLEAMASGLPSIATDVGGSGDALGRDEECGLLIQPGNVEQLASSIVKLSSNSTVSEKMGLMARKRIMEVYDLEVVGENYKRLYDRLLS